MSTDYTPTLADQIAFNEGLQEHIGDLLDAMKPFVSLMKETSGRIPTERLSFADWHKLTKAFDAAKQAVCVPAAPSAEASTPAARDEDAGAKAAKALEDNHREWFYEQRDYPAKIDYAGVARVINAALSSPAAQTGEDKAGDGWDEVQAIRDAIEPVIDWYQAHPDDTPTTITHPRLTVDIVKDLVADLQSDRAEVLKLRKAALTPAFTVPADALAKDDAELLAKLEALEETRRSERRFGCIHQTVISATELDYVIAQLRARIAGQDAGSRQG